MSTSVEEINVTESARLPTAWCERQVQDSLYVHCAIKNHEIVVPNSCVFGWESDLVSVNKTGFVTEFEIKVSRADFKAESKKAHRKLLVDPVQKSGVFGDVTHPRPNYFYFAVPDGLIRPEEVPDYAGLIYVKRRAETVAGRVALYYGTAVEVKPAARLHREKITEWQRKQLARALTGRYWKQRVRASATEEAFERRV
jgi:hypothetical protein